MPVFCQVRQNRSVTRVTPMLVPHMSRLSGNEGDGDLYKLAVEGDRAAVEALVTRYNADMTLYLRAKTDDHAVVDDAVADAWLRFYRHLREAGEDPSRALDKPESVRFWLYRTTLNAMRDHFRKASRQTDLSRRVTSDAVASGETSYQADELASLEGDERRSALREAFAKLGEACRELLTLLLADPPLSYAEVAEMLGRPVGSLGPTRQRCLGDLRQAMGVTV